MVTAEWLAAVALLAVLVYIAAEQRTIAALRRQAAEARAMLERHAALRADVRRPLAGRDELPAALQRCAEAIVTRLDAALVQIWTLSRDESTLELQASAGLSTRLDGPDARIPVGQRHPGLIARERTPHTDDLGRDPRTNDPAWAAQEGLAALAGYPLLVGDRLAGVVAAFSRRPMPPAMLDALELVAEALAQGIERRRASEVARKECSSPRASGSATPAAGPGSWPPTS